MAYVPSYEHDVFVSYDKHVDDEPEPGRNNRVGHHPGLYLKHKLAQKLGRSDAFSLWMDHELRGHASVSRQIVDTLERTATLVVILSPGYIASSWCQRERGAFLSHLAKRRGSSSQIFVVRRDRDRRNRAGRVWGSHWLPVLGAGQPGDNPAHSRAPRPDPSDRRYYDRLNDLATELAEHLKSLREPTQRGPQKVTPDQRPTIFIAEPTDDLDEVHHDVKRYLQQAGMRVYPDRRYPRYPGAFQRAATRDLAKCDVFVQLLSGSVGKRTPDVPDGYAHLQLQMAESSGKPILQWRIEDLDTGRSATPGTAPCSSAKRSSPSGSRSSSERSRSRC